MAEIWDTLRIAVKHVLGSCGVQRIAWYERQGSSKGDGAIGVGGSQSLSPVAAPCASCTGVKSDTPVSELFPAFWPLHTLVVFTCLPSGPLCSSRTSIKGSNCGHQDHSKHEELQRHCHTLELVAGSKVKWCFGFFERWW